MADNIRLVTFAGSTVTPQDDALVYETAINQNGIISGGAVTLKNNNTLHIAAGHGIICGRKFTIVESDITVLLTTGDTHLGRAYIHLDLSNTTDPIQILTETGSALSAPIQQPDVNISNGIYEIDLVTFTIDALTISNLVDLRPTVEKIIDIINEMKEKVDNAEVDTLTTMEQVRASTDKKKSVGVGAIQELDSSLGTLRFGIDGDNNYGYYKADDSFVPFSKFEFKQLIKGSDLAYGVNFVLEENAMVIASGTNPSTDPTHEVALFINDEKVFTSPTAGTYYFHVPKGCVVKYATNHFKSYSGSVWYLQ